MGDAAWRWQNPPQKKLFFTVSYVPDYFLAGHSCFLETGFLATAQIQEIIRKITHCKTVVFALQFFFSVLSYSNHLLASHLTVCQISVFPKISNFCSNHTVVAMCRNCRKWEFEKHWHWTWVLQNHLISMSSSDDCVIDVIDCATSRLCMCMSLNVPINCFILTITAYRDLAVSLGSRLSKCFIMKTSSSRSLSVTYTVHSGV